MKDENENTPFNDGSNNFDTPEGYFHRSANSIFNKIGWQEEHTDFPHLLKLKNERDSFYNGFSTPLNFFNENEARLELLQYSKLSSLKGTSGFLVPGDYFSEKEIEELSKVIIEERDELQSFQKLKLLKKENNFKVSENYFDKNVSRTITLLDTNKKERVINLFTRKIAFAAAALMILSLGLWIYDFYFTEVKLEDCGTISCIEKRDLLKAKNLESMDNDELYELVNARQLEINLKNNKKSDNIEKSDSSLKEVSTDDLLDEI